MAKTIITGNTYPARFLIKSLGGFKWNPKFKSWEKNYIISEEEKEKLSAFRGLEVQFYNEREGVFTEVLDTRSHKQIYGKCEDAPCCGCCGPQFY